MLVIPLKTSKRYDIGTPLATWIEASHPYYSTQDCREDLIRLSSLRNCLSSAICTPSGHAAAVADRALEDAMEYHACLMECERRGFPTKDDSMAGAQDLKLSWNDAFGEEEPPIVRSNIRYERSSVLFNVAALLSYKASVVNMATREGMAKAPSLYQTSAAILKHLRTDLMGGKNLDANPSVDLTSPCLLMCEKLMLAQGQNCTYFLAKSRPKPMHQLLAKIATGAADLYNEALSHSQDDVVKSKLPKTSSSWGMHIKATTMLFSARAQWHESVRAKEMSEWGEEIARLMQVETMCNEALTFHQESVACSGGDMALLAEIEGLQRLAEQRKAVAERDNIAIYLDAVPDTKDLKTISSHNMMAKQTPLPETLEPSSLKRPFFANLPSV